MKNNLLKIAILLFVIFLTFYLFFSWLSRDEELSLESRKLVSQVQFYNADIADNHPYFFVLGFDAATNVDSYALGKLRYQHGWKSFLNDFNALDVDEKQLEKITVMSENYLEQSDFKFIKKLRDDSENNSIYQQMTEHQTELFQIYYRQNQLIEKFEDYLILPPVDKGLLLSPNNQIPNYPLILSVHYLYLSKLALHGTTKDVAEYTKQLILKSQEMSSTIDKMIVLNMISQNISLLHELNLKFPKLKQTVPLLTMKGVSFESQFALEVANFYVITQLLANHKNINFYDFIFSGNSSGEKGFFRYKLLDFFVPILFLENSSTNQYVKRIMPIIELSKLSNPDFKEKLHYQYELINDEIKIKNYIGERFVNIAQPSWKRYIIASRLINQKIYLLNLLVENSDPQLNEINHNIEGYEFYINNRELCIKSPDPHLNAIDQKRYRSCLKI